MAPSACSSSTRLGWMTSSSVRWPMPGVAARVARRQRGAVTDQPEAGLAQPTLERAGPQVRRRDEPRTRTALPRRPERRPEEVITDEASGSGTSAERRGSSGWCSRRVTQPVDRGVLVDAGQGWTQSVPSVSPSVASPSVPSPAAPSPSVPSVSPSVPSPSIEMAMVSPSSHLLSMSLLVMLMGPTLPLRRDREPGGPDRLRPDHLRSPRWSARSCCSATARATGTRRTCSRAGSTSTSPPRA